VLLARIVHTAGLSLDGRTVTRSAVRAIVCRRPRSLLLLHSPGNGDYKFPGGGVRPGESWQDALRREVLEECGARVLTIGDMFGEVVEYAAAREEDQDVFQMTSRYIACEVEDGFGEQRLDDYERDLGLRPVWVEVDEALAVNDALLRSGSAVARWVTRETLVLRLVKQHLVDGEDVLGRTAPQLGAQPGRSAAR
jgi:8-oxo-dGTP pyrophosphatase MutT (NUDIX family)